MYKPIADYGAIGNQRTVALVGRDGSLDWLCLPDLDSPSLFAALLDDDRGGRFRIAPARGFSSRQSYLGETNVLQTVMTTGTGSLVLTDFMPAGWPGEVTEEELPTVWRRLEAVSGSVEVEVLFDPRFDYARRAPEMVMTPFGVVARARAESCALFGPGEFRLDDRGRARATLRLAAGERTWFVMRYGRPADMHPPGEPEARLEATLRFWRSWLARCERGHCEDFGRFRAAINRSSLLLKLLTFEPTGAIAAAPTTSLPEWVGGERNWDYRYCWLRDASLTVRALHAVGHLSEMEGFLAWLRGTCGGRGAEGLQIVYGLRGEARLTESELGHLEGYRGSRPVRVGNGAHAQRQMDVFGEVLDAALRLSDYAGAVDEELWLFLRAVCDHVCRTWTLPDRGIWEVRRPDSHFVHSKLMCWVTLDRGLKIAGRYGFSADTDLWRRNREALREQVLRQGWSEARGSFVQSYGSEALDASLLLLPTSGLLRPSDPRLAATVEAIRAELGRNGFLYRYLAQNGLTDDGLAGREGCFLVLNFWLAEALVALGRAEEAEGIIEGALQAASPLGLFPEEYDPATGELLGNYPQAFTHIGLINACASLLAARRARRGRKLGERVWWFMPVGRRVLNDLPVAEEVSGPETAARLRRASALLQGAFFDPEEGRVDYERMRGSAAFADYEAAAAALQRFDPRQLGPRPERLAFWINLYNTLIIHGVVEAGIQESVKEVPGFFRRIAYRVGAREFSPDDIEHGILRGNAGHGLLGRLQFPEGDPRRGLVVTPPDPRVHFALVCGASSCPPVAVYEAERLDEQLELSGRSFLRRHGFRLERRERRVHLSRIFDWYGRDFGPDLPAVLRFLLPYIEPEEERRFVAAHLEELEERFMPYDWRLNRRLE